MFYIVFLRSDFKLENTRQVKRMVFEKDIKMCNFPYLYKDLLLNSGFNPIASSKQGAYISD